MENEEDGGGCCCEGSSAGSRICVCVSVFLGIQYIKLFLTEQDSKYLNGLKDLDY